MPATSTSPAPAPSRSARSADSALRSEHRDPLLTAAVHSTGMLATCIALATALTLSTAGPLGFAFDPAEVCAGILDLPESAVGAGTIRGVQACEVGMQGRDAPVAVVPVQPAWWPHLAAGCLLLALAALGCVAAALLVRHTARPRRARRPQRRHLRSTHVKPFPARHLAARPVRCP